MRPVASALSLAAVMLMVCCGTVAQPGRQYVAQGRIVLPEAAATIGISHTRSPAEFNLGGATNRSTASREFGLEVIRNPGEAAWAVPAAYVLGRVIGSTLGVSESALAAGRRSADLAATEFPARESLGRAVHAALRSHPESSSRDLEDGFPVEPGASHGRMTLAGRSHLTWVDGKPEAHPLQGSVIDTLIGLRVDYAGFRPRPDLRPESAGRGGCNEFNPPLVLTLAVQISAVKVSDWSCHGDISLQCDSGPRRFEEWTAHDARILRAELAAAWDHIHREIAARLVRAH